MKEIHLIISILFTSITLFAQRTPGKAQSKTIVIQGATIHVGNGNLIEHGTLIFTQGKITYVGESGSAPLISQATTVNAEGKHVYPGFISPNSNLGLIEIGAVKATNDQGEIGKNNANIRSIIAYNAESKVIETVRPNGVLVAQITPRGSLFAGKSSIVQLDAWNWEDAIITVDDGLHINWPKIWVSPNSKSYNKQLKQQKKEVEYIHNSFTQAMAYDENEGIRLNLKAIQEIVRKNKRIYVDVRRAEEILKVIALKKKFGLKHLVIVNGYEAPMVMEALKEAKIPVLVNRVHSTPWRSDEDIEYTYKLPKILYDGGVLVGLENSGDMQAMNTRNLPFYAGTLVTHGMDKEDALKLISSNTAKILGVEDKLGTLEVGKDATIYISEGDALDVRTNNPFMAFINGRILDLNTFQKELYKKYRRKYHEN